MSGTTTSVDETIEEGNSEQHFVGELSNFTLCNCFFLDPVQIVVIVEVAVDPTHLDLEDLEATRIQEIGVDEKVYIYIYFI